MDPVSRPVPDADRIEPRIGDDHDPEQGPPVEADEELADEELEESPAVGVVDPEHPDPPEPGEPG